MKIARCLTLTLLVNLMASELTTIPLTIPGTDPRSLLRVHTTFREQPRPDTSIRIDSDRLITRGGGLIAIRTSGLNEFPQEVSAITGRGTAADLAALGRALTAGEAGSAKDCSVDGFGRTGRAEITWYGRAGRRNTFTIEFREGEPPLDDRCPPVTLAIFDAIIVFEEAAERNP